MVGYPAYFNATSQSQLNPEFVSGTWADVSGQVVVRLLFDAIMDTSVVPDVSSWELRLATVVRAVESIIWDSSTELRLVSVIGIPAVDPVTIELLNSDVNLHQLGGEVVLPFGPETLPEL